MTDRISPERRSWNMSRIPSKNTRPEIRVRSVLHSMGYRFRLHDSTLPGSPDIVLKKHRTIILVHGCYWHRHKVCTAGQYFPKNPSQGIQFWKDKFSRNVSRDAENIILLRSMGWTVHVIWECEAKDKEVLRKRIETLFKA